MNANTDSALSLESAEFLWDTPGTIPAHAYLLPTIKNWLKSSGAKTVLDLGCGNGALTAALSAEGFTMTGMDRSESGLALASRSFPAIRFLHSELAMPIEKGLHQQFDAVISVEVVEHLLLPRLLLHRVKEALRPGGVCILTTPYHGYLKNLALAMTNSFDAHWHPLRDYGHVKFFSRKTLSQLLTEQQFTVERCARVGRIPWLAKSMIVQARGMER